MPFKPIALIICFLIHLNAHATSREWTALDGRTMQAEFVKTEKMGARVEIVFRKDDGMLYRVPLSSLRHSDQQAIQELSARPDTTTATASGPQASMTAFELAITKDVVRLKGSRMKAVPQTELQAKDYYAIYYSAHWCPPCRRFTPKLVDFYEKASREHNNFEIIFVSSDRSEDDMESYMDEADMPWLALEFEKKKQTKELTKYAGGGIPCLVLVDQNGNILSDSYVNGKYVGPTRVMDYLKETLAE